MPREPLVHFLLLGGGLFLLFHLVADPGERGSNDTVLVEAARVETLAAEFERAWGRPPTREELDALVEDHVREEIALREALAMGLDRDDEVVRRRLTQRLELLAAEPAAAVEPDDGELAAFLAEHPERFRLDGRMSFEHLFFHPIRRGPGAADDARRLLNRLRAGEEPGDLGALGDPLSLPTTYRGAPSRKVAERFGEEFVEELGGLPLGEWAGPVESVHGLHLVRLLDREEGRLPTLEEVRDEVAREWGAMRREQVVDAYYRELRRRYEVEVVQPARPGAVR
ncbi:MAG: peptidylprolyl isomerase [Thermoanaerobaculia bacterium]|nr:peptidylprolyl isomerase [Thermoanaerobaculia bacterium]